jgi:nitroimidazol reductase NimA-like FMN-containing flavoprotein (pyridoxamine 5'-phosphate oxidase superfamily)
MDRARDSQGLIILDREACLDRLAGHRLAAMAITEQAMPLVLPVVYALHDGEILIGTDPSGVLGRRLPNSVVSLCVHDLNDELLSGWTVTVVGEAFALETETELPSDVRQRLWHPGCVGEQAFVRISTERMSGRQIPD